MMNVPITVFNCQKKKKSMQTGENGVMVKKERKDKRVKKVKWVNGY